MNLSQQFFNLIKKSKNILISFPIDWNGDAISGSLALYLYLKKIGKNVEIGAEKIEGENNFNIPTDSFKFLPSFSSIKTSLENLMKFVVSVDLKNAKVSQIKYTIEDDYLNFIISPRDGFFTSKDIKSSMQGFKYDLIIAVSCRDLESLGRIYDNNIDFFYKTDIINIDYSPENEGFGQVNIVDLNAVSATEVIYDLISNNLNSGDFESNLIDENIATCLLTGIIFKTKSFKTTNITPKTLKISSKLIELGAKREDIVANLYRSRSLKTLKLWGRVLNNLVTVDDNSIIWSILYKNDFNVSNSSEENLQDVIDELILSIPTAKVIVIFYSMSEIIISDNNLEIEEGDNSEKVSSADDDSDKKENSRELENKGGNSAGEKFSFSDKTIIRHNDSDSIFETKVLIHALKNINSLDLIRDLRPRGTKSIAQVTIKRPIKEVEKEIIAKIKNRLEKIF